MGFEKTVKIHSFDVDAAGFARPGSLMRWMQQLAGDDVAQFGFPYPVMREKGYVFVLFALRLKIKKPLRCDDEYTLQTYSIGTHGATFTRDFYFQSQGEAVAEASTKWVLLDFVKRKIVHSARPDFEGLHHPDKASEIVVPKRLDASAAQKTDVRRVYPSMLDENNHLNNCVYADIVTDYLPLRHDRFVSDLQILFTHEAAPLEELEIRTASGDNGESILVHAHNLTRDIPCFTATAITESITKGTEYV